MSVPPDLYIPFDYDFVADAIKKRSGDDVAQAFKILHDAILELYATLANAVNNGPDYVEAATQPTPDDGCLLVWKDTTTGTYYLLFNDGGTIKSCTFS